MVISDEEPTDEVSCRGRFAPRKTLLKLTKIKSRDGWRIRNELVLRRSLLGDGRLLLLLGRRLEDLLLLLGDSFRLRRRFWDTIRLRLALPNKKEA